MIDTLSRIFSHDYIKVIAAMALIFGLYRVFRAVSS